MLLAQALSNLIDNALKFAPENGAIDVEVRQTDGAVRPYPSIPPAAADRTVR